MRAQSIGALDPWLIQVRTGRSRASTKIEKVIDRKSRHYDGALMYSVAATAILSVLALKNALPWIFLVFSPFFVFTSVIFPKGLWRRGKVVPLTA